MTTKQCESKIRTLMECIKEIYKQYRGDCEYLSLVIVNGDIEFHNRYYGEDSDFPIEYCSRDRTATRTQSREDEDD